MDPNENLRVLRATAKQLMVEDKPMHVQHVRDLAEHFEALDEWLTKGGFLPSSWRQAPSTLLYEKCRDCHLFVEPNVAWTEGSDIAPFMHLARGNDADERLDADHEPFPSGMKANLATWQVFGPVLMRERFVTPKEYC